VVALICGVSVVLAPGAGDPRPPTAGPHSAAPGADACARGVGKGSAFPVDARIHGRPGTYRSGDGFRDWAIDLVSHASAVCRNIHPVVVLVDRKRVLQPGQLRLEFHDGVRWRAVRMAHTDRDENVGAFDAFPGFSGFTLRPGVTVTVRVRLALTADAVSDDVVAMAVVVRRRGGDGDWVGGSGQYPFSVVGGG
jgi:hypothetical protein